MVTFQRKEVRLNLFDLTRPFDAYFFGFAEADGHLCETTRNRGRLTIELAAIDEQFLVMLQQRLPVKSTIRHRMRTTNFSAAHRSVALTISHLSARRSLTSLGFPIGAKSWNIAPPIGPYSTIDYWRGIIDADGSLGLTGAGFPFLSLVTVSEQLASAYFEFCNQVVGYRPRPNKNQRDSAYNICLSKEHAIEMARLLYLSNSDAFAMQRKLERAHKISAWRRPPSMRRIVERAWWDTTSDEIVRSMSVKDAAATLGRSVSSVANRRFRLRLAPRPENHPLN